MFRTSHSACQKILSSPFFFSHPESRVEEIFAGGRNEKQEEKTQTKRFIFAKNCLQGAAEGEWHKASKEQGIMWLDGSDEEQEGHEGSAGGERCEVCGRVEVWSEESEEQGGRGEQGEARGEKETEEMRRE